MIQLEGLKFGVSLGCSCPEMMELSILREVRRAHGRIMTLDLRETLGNAELERMLALILVELQSLQEQPPQSLGVSAFNKVHSTLEQDVS